MLKIIFASIIFVHSWYDPQCCSGMDCEPLATAPSISSNGESYVMPNGALFPMSEVRPSQDSKWHWCHIEDKYGGKAVYCVYEPVNV